MKIDRQQPEDIELMTMAEVAKAFRVDPKTVTRWANAGKFRVVRTLGGHRRAYAEDIRNLLSEVEGA